MLQERGLSTAVLKADLVERLKAAIESSGGVGGGDSSKKKKEQLIQTSSRMIF